MEGSDQSLYMGVCMTQSQSVEEKMDAVKGQLPLATWERLVLEKCVELGWLLRPRSSPGEMWRPRSRKALARWMLGSTRFQNKGSSGWILWGEGRLPASYIARATTNVPHMFMLVWLNTHTHTHQQIHIQHNPVFSFSELFIIYFNCLRKDFSYLGLFPE